jgi:cytochrome c6
MREKLWVTPVCLAAIFLLPMAGSAEPAKGESGKALFEQHCAVCHPNGGNIINPKFTLHKKDRDAHGITKTADIIGKMRHPGPGMTKFDKSTIPDKDARKIANYILRTFR